MNNNYQHSVPRHIRELIEGYLYYEKHNGVNLNDIPIVSMYVGAILQQMYNQLGNELYRNRVLLSDVEILINLMNNKLVLFRRTNVI